MWPLQQIIHEVLEHLLTTVKCFLYIINENFLRSSFSMILIEYYQVSYDNIVY